MPVRPTIEDVAQIAGVSTATVSRALHTPAVVSPVTRARVTAAVLQTGYTLNAAAQSLRQRRANAVLVVVPSIGNTFFSEILGGIEQRAAQAGLTMLIGDTGRDPEREAAYIRFLLNGRADGALLLTAPVPAWFDAPRVAGSPVAPVVSISETNDSADMPHVGIDNEAAAFTAVSHLLDRGHRRIAHVTGPAWNVLTPLRIAGYRRALRAAGLPDRDHLMIAGDFSADSGGDAARALIAARPRPTAAFCSNDEMAMGLIAALHRAGVAVPRDLSVVGFDDIAFAGWFIPALTTIRQPRRAMGETAMAILSAILDGSFDPDRHRVTLDAELVLRDSVAPPRLT